MADDEDDAESDTVTRTKVHCAVRWSRSGAADAVDAVPGVAGVEPAGAVPTVADGLANVSEIWNDTGNGQLPAPDDPDDPSAVLRRAERDVRDAVDPL